MIAEFDYITNSFRQTCLEVIIEWVPIFQWQISNATNEQLTKFHHYDEWVKLVLIEKSVGSISSFKENGEQSWLALSMVTQPIKFQNLRMAPFSLAKVWTYNMKGRENYGLTEESIVLLVVFVTGWASNRMVGQLAYHESCCGQCWNRY